MGSFFDEIPPNLMEWILRQKIFFVASAAINGGPDSFVNMSPKEIKAFHLVGPNRCWYADATGSGIQTIAHLRQPGNNHLTIMFVAFEGGPRIVRLFGNGKVHERTTPGFEKFLPPGDERIRPGTRAVIELEITKVGSSCGFSIPYFDYKAERPTLDNSARKKILQDLEMSDDSLAKVDGTDCLPPSIESDFSEVLRSNKPIQKNGLREYWQQKNSLSMEGLPALQMLVPQDQMVGFNGQKRQSGAGVKTKGRRVEASMLQVVAILSALLLGVAIGLKGREILQRV